MLTTSLADLAIMYNKSTCITIYFSDNKSASTTSYKFARTKLNSSRRPFGTKLPRLPATDCREEAFRRCGQSRRGAHKKNALARYIGGMRTECGPCRWQVYARSLRVSMLA